MGDRKNEPLQNLSFVKSNEMISAKYKASLLENQVMAIALTRIEVNVKDEDSPLVARLYPNELKRLVSDPAHIYRDLKQLGKTITGHTMFIEDGKGNFEAFSVVPNAEYKDGVFTVKFNSALKEHILGLDRDFTTLELSVMTDFTKNASFRIYELLKKDAYKINPKVNEGRIDVEYNVSELRFMIGLANSDDPAVKNEMARMGRHIDWDVLYQKLDKKDKKYERYAELSRSVIKPAQKELEEKSDIRFEYEGLRDGRRISRILFHVYRNEPSVDVVEKKKVFDQATLKQADVLNDLSSYAPLYKELVGHNGLTKENIDLLLKDASYDVDKVRNAVGMADEQAHVKNYLGWIRSCIKENYVKTETIEGSSKRAEDANTLKSAFDKEKMSGKMQKNVWNTMKAKEDFPVFIEMVESYGLTLEALEVTFEPKQLVQLYVDWKVGRPNDIFQ